MLDHLTAFELECKGKNLRPKTLEFYTWQLGQFRAWLATQGITNVEEVRKATIQGYLVYQKERGLKDRSVHASFRAIRTFFNFLEADEWITHNPVKKLKAPRVDQVPIKGFSETEIGHLVAGCTNVRNRCILHVLLDTLCRASELVAVNIADVDIGQQVVYLRHTKNRKARQVILSTKTCKVLLKYLRTREPYVPGDPLFVSRTTGRRLTYHGLAMIFKQLGERTGIRTSIHHTRRSGALLMYNNGCDLATLKALLDHADYKQVQTYLAISSDQVVQNAKRFAVMDNL
jgi:site-specific recombinase XerD